VQLDEEYAQLVTLPEGLITHFRAFFSWDKAPRAAGLDPADIALPTQGHASKAASPTG
jgi:hypothetical protein